MSAREKRDMPASIRQRLLNLSRERNMAFDLVLVRYGIERLLYRLTCSEHSDAFLLKGAMLFAVWSPQTHRPTRDVDLLGFGHAELKDIEGIFKGLCEQPVLDDGLAFLSASVEVAYIREEARYGGVRVSMMAKLGNARIPLQVDIGYGDAVTPGPEKVTFPSLLALHAPILRAYPIYTVVAEKFEALVSLSATNTRMKDFFDLWFLSENFDFEANVLSQAIRATFDRRGTALLASDEIVGLSDAFAADRKAIWDSFLIRNGLGRRELREILDRLKRFLLPMVHAEKANKSALWKAGLGWDS